MLLVIAYSRAARQALRNRCNAHPETVVRRFGRAVCLAETELGAFLALRLRERYGGDVQVERTRALNEFREVPERVRDAAVAYETRQHPNTPYTAFAAGTDHPDTDEMAEREL
ncbi:hypothetical protein [Halospeciosus flavus]|uniref:Uncharacterized protein n=1 Tax=Halospeciosus flavus TaxID=3032283 RepID=A0ABD5Z7Q0_9EURY|nr:hypothetical protein [Halospeciosus flavus]